MHRENCFSNEIRLHELIDGRLEWLGITTDNGDERAALLAPDDTAVLVVWTADGHALLPRKTPILIRNGMAAEVPATATGGAF